MQTDTAKCTVCILDEAAHVCRLRARSAESAAGFRPCARPVVTVQWVLTAVTHKRLLTIYVSSYHHLVLPVVCQVIMMLQA